MTDKSEEHPFEEAIRILKDVPDAIDFLVKHAKDARWDCVQKAHKILTDHLKRLTMREIKFRAWDGSKMWNWEDITKDKEILCSVMRNEFYATIPPKYFWQRQQYTGLKDKNGVEIYEGDIVEIYNDEYLVHWNEIKAKWELGDRWAFIPNKICEVVGNIFEGVNK